MICLTSEINIYITDISTSINCTVVCFCLYMTEVWIVDFTHIQVMLFSLVQLTAVSSEVSEITVETLLSLLPLLSGTHSYTVHVTMVE